MSKSKRSNKSTPKKEKEIKNNNLTLIQYLINKHQLNSTITTDLNSQKALILQAVLTGTDQQLLSLLQKTNKQQIEAVVGGWTQKSVLQLSNRLLDLLQNNSNLAIYPWLKAAIERSGTLDLIQQNRVKIHLQAKQQHNLDDVLKLSGKLDLFDF